MKSPHTDKNLAKNTDLARRALMPHFKKWITQAQIVHDTGLSVFEVEDALSELMKDYPCRMDVNDRGELLYWFDWARLREPTPSAWEQLLRGLGFVFRFVFKLWITLTLCTLGLFYALVFSVVVFAASKDPSMIILPFWVVYWTVKSLIKGVQRYLKTGGNTEQEREKDDLLLYIFDYFWGAPLPDEHLTTEKRVLAYLREHKYMICTADLVLITGWSRQQAQEELTRLLSRYRGTPKVSEEGILYVEFPEIRVQSDASSFLGETSRHYAWQNPLPQRDYPSSYENNLYGILTVVLSCMLISGAALSYFAPLQGQEDFYEWSIWTLIPNPSQISFWNSYFTLAFALVGLTLTLVNDYYRTLMFNANRLRQRENLSLKLLYENMPLIPNSLLDKAQLADLERRRVDLEGEPTVTEEGEPAQSFEHFYQEWKTLCKLRGHYPAAIAGPAPNALRTDEGTFGYLLFKIVLIWCFALPVLWNIMQAGGE